MTNYSPPPNSAKCIFCGKVPEEGKFVSYLMQNTNLIDVQHSLVVCDECFNSEDFDKAEGILNGLQRQAYAVERALQRTQKLREQLVSLGVDLTE